MYPNYYQTPLHQEVIRVSGENGARMYQMAPNSSVLLLDETAPIVWLKMTDGAGYPTITPYKIEQIKPEPPAGYYSLDANFTVLGTGAGNVTIQLYQNGVAIPGAVATETVADNTYSMVSIPAVIKQACCIGGTITAVLTGTGATITNASMVVS